MTQEDKNFLLKDLCARLPYGVKVQMGDGAIEELQNVNVSTFICNGLRGLPKPYLSPISSMTDEQNKELLVILEDKSDDEFEYKVVDFYNKNHIDYRGLIEKGLAIDATGLNIY